MQELVVLSVSNWVARVVMVMLLVFFFMPFIFQIVAGKMALRGKIRLKFWLVCTLSIVSQIIGTIAIIMQMSYNIQKSGIRDGLGFLFVEWLGLFMIVVILIIIGFQIIINKIKQKKQAKL